MYAILRSDLDMNSGKAASQAGHAFLDSFLTAPPDIQHRYCSDDEDNGTKIVLSAGAESDLSDIFFHAKKANFPCAMVVEQNHVMPPHFDGSPIVTAIGLGPLRRSEAKALTRGFHLLK